VSKSTIEELQSENQRLRGLIVSLSATLLRDIAVDPPTDGRGSNRADVERLMHEAEDCFRCAKLPGLKKEIAQGLEAAGHELMAKAVEIETVLDKEKRGK
jgi:hypothetical protein